MRRSGKARARILTIDAGKVSRRTDALAVEEPLEIQLQASTPHAEPRTLAVTMRTPGNDYELAAGFLYNEGIIAHKDDIDHMIYCVDGRLEQQEYNLLRVRLRSAELPNLQQLDRHFFTTSACGVCGRTMLESLETQSLPPLPQGPIVSSDFILGLPAHLRNAQTLFEQTGGLHAAALFDTEGNLLCLREDIGRHNALDKLIGWAILNQRFPLDQHVLLVSGRAGYELLQKCRAAGIAIFCAVSAPSSLAVELAQRFEITLVAFLREDRFNIYAGVERIQT